MPRGLRPSFTFQVEDDGSTANGGVNLDPTPKLFAFNTAPVASDTSYAINSNMVLDESLDVTHLELSGDWIGAGITYEGDGSPGSFSASGNENYATISYNLGNEYWQLTFGAPSGTSLAPGTYNVPQQYQHSTEDPYLAVYGNGHYFWNYAYGQFTVNQVVFGPTGALEQFDATFVEFPGVSGSAAVRGRVQYHSSATGAIGVLGDASDTDGDPLTAILVSGPQHGGFKPR